MPINEFHCCKLWSCSLTLVWNFPSLLLPSIRLLSLALEVPVHGGGEFFPSRIRMSLCWWIHNLRWKQHSIGGRMKKQLGEAGPLSTGRLVEKCRNGKGPFNSHSSFLHFNLKGRATLGGAWLLVNAINKVLNEKYKSGMVNINTLLRSARLFYVIHFLW